MSRASPSGARQWKEDLRERRPLEGDGKHEKKSKYSAARPMMTPMAISLGGHLMILKYTSRGVALQRRRGRQRPLRHARSSFGGIAYERAKTLPAPYAPADGEASYRGTRPTSGKLPKTILLPASRRFSSEGHIASGKRSEVGNLLTASLTRRTPSLRSGHLGLRHFSDVLAEGRLVPSQT